MIPLLLLAIACSAPTPHVPLGPVFVRGGVVVADEDGTQGQALPDGRRLVAQPWSPGASVEVAGIEQTASLVAECLPLFHVSLGDLGRFVTMGSAAPDTALAFSPDGTRLAVGTYTGELVVVDAWSGQVLGRRHLAESMVKRVAWSPDSETVYAAEQSPDAFVHALDPTDLSSRWRVRLADRVGTSAPPSADDLYGVYTLPAAYGLHVLPTGALLVAAVHAWNDDDGTRHNQSALLLLGPDGTERAAWPEADEGGAASVTLMHPHIDRQGELVAVPVGRSASGASPEDLPVGGVQVLLLPDLEPLSETSYLPLEPWFSSVFLWEAVDVSGESGHLAVGLSDGRLVLHDLLGPTLWVRDLGTPILADEVPIAASIAHVKLVDDGLLVLTAGTTIPYGARTAETRPPSPHPGANALWALGLDGRLRWTWRGPHDLEGLSLGADGRTVVVTAGPRRADARHDLYGALLFDREREGSGAARLLTTCATEGPAFFRAASTVDGRLALAEYPYAEADGSLRGAYQVTVFR